MMSHSCIFTPIAFYMGKVLAEACSRKSSALVLIFIFPNLNLNVYFVLFIKVLGYSVLTTMLFKLLFLFSNL